MFDPVLMHLNYNVGFGVTLAKAKLYMKRVCNPSNSILWNTKVFISYIITRKASVPDSKSIIAYVYIHL